MAIALELQDVSVAFRTPDGIAPVIYPLSLQIAETSWTAIVGPNGSGKSTLGRVMAGLCEVSGGSVVRTSGRIQMVFQNPDAQLVGQTVYEDVCFGLENHAVPEEEMSVRAKAALAEVGLTHLLHADVSRLSGGQKQLLCIASALCLRPSVLVFDEATAMLDPRSRSHVLNVVRRIHQAGTTVIWITQWMEELSAAQRVIALDTGRVVFDGTPEMFFYGSNSQTPNVEEALPAPCERLGFPLPFSIQLAKSLKSKGVSLGEDPLSVADIAAGVVSR